MECRASLAILPFRHLFIGTPIVRAQAKAEKAAAKEAAAQAKAQAKAEKAAAKEAAAQVKAQAKAEKAAAREAARKVNTGTKKGQDKLILPVIKNQPEVKASAAAC